MNFVREVEFVVRGPKGRHEIATPVRAWIGDSIQESRRPEGPTPPFGVSIYRAAPSALNRLDRITVHDLTVVAVS
jgi:hypothetical protein